MYFSLAKKEASNSHLEVAELEASAASGVTDLTRGDIVIPLSDILPELTLTNAVAASAPYKDLVSHEVFATSANSTTYRSFWRAQPTAFKQITSSVPHEATSLLFSPDFKAFRREVLIHSSLKHPNITTITVRLLGSLASTYPCRAFASIRLGSSRTCPLISHCASCSTRRSPSTGASASRLSATWCTPWSTYRVCSLINRMVVLRVAR